MELPLGYDPKSSAYGALVLPIKLQKQMEPAKRVELVSIAYRAIALPLSYTGMMGALGFEPKTTRL